MLYTLMFLFTFTIGGLTGIFLGALAVDVHLHDTYFVVAHFHYVMMGGTVIAFLGGMHHWWPKMTGRMYNETWGRKIASVVVFIGFNLTFFPQFIAGHPGHAAPLRDLRRRVHRSTTSCRPSARWCWASAWPSCSSTCWRR
jgi:cytochrome c oxidase subunit 1